MVACLFLFTTHLNVLIMKKMYFLLLALLPLLAVAQIADSTQREVKLQGAINFRDLGGYTTKDGKHVKWGKIYRSASLNKLTDADLAKLHSLSLAYVADFRGPYEVKTAPDKLPAQAIRVSLPAGSENIGDSNYMKQMMMTQNKDSAILSFYSNITPFKERYKPVFDEMLQLPADSAMLFHCTAGKDRTGIAAALILYALGVDEETIVEDYLATNYYRATENEKSIAGMMHYGMNETTARNMMAAKREYLEAAYMSIMKQYGSIDTYLTKEMDLTPAKLSRLKQMYLN